MHEAGERLKEILNDKVLRFNPFWVSDEELLACAQRGYWRPFPALTQMVIFHFLNIRRVIWHCDYDAIFYRVGESDKEYSFPLNYFSLSMAHHVTKSPLRVQANGKNITRTNAINLQNRSFFVSHAISCSQVFGPNRSAYKMHRLRGDLHRQAETIRQQMITAKIGMLEEVLQYPTSPLYLGPTALQIDYTTPIRTTIANISRFPTLPKP